MKKLFLILVVALMVSCCTESTTQVMGEVKTEKPGQSEEIVKVYSSEVSTYVYITEDGIRYRVFTFGNGVEDAGLFVINETLQKEQLEYYQKIY